jgi:hypothetical protein
MDRHSKSYCFGGGWLDGGTIPFIRKYVTMFP